MTGAANIRHDRVCGAGCGKFAEGAPPCRTAEAHCTGRGHSWPLHGCAGVPSTAPYPLTYGIRSHMYLDHDWPGVWCPGLPCMVVESWNPPATPASLPPGCGLTHLPAWLTYRAAFLLHGSWAARSQIPANDGKTSGLAWELSESGRWITVAWLKGVRSGKTVSSVHAEACGGMHVIISHDVGCHFLSAVMASSRSMSVVSSANNPIVVRTPSGQMAGTDSYGNTSHLFCSCPPSPTNKSVQQHPIAKLAALPTSFSSAISDSDCDLLVDTSTNQARTQATHTHTHTHTHTNTQTHKHTNTNTQTQSPNLLTLRSLRSL